MHSRQFKTNRIILQRIGLFQSPMSFTLNIFRRIQPVGLSFTGLLSCLIVDHHYYLHLAYGRFFVAF